MDPENSNPHTDFEIGLYWDFESFLWTIVHFFLLTIDNTEASPPKGHLVILSTDAVVDENAVVVVEQKKGEIVPKAGRVFGPIPREIAELGMQAIVSLAPEII